VTATPASNDGGLGSAARETGVLIFLARRWLALLPTLFLASIFVFTIIQLAPGDPVRMKLGPEATPEQVAIERSGILDATLWRRRGKGAEKP